LGSKKHYPIISGPFWFGDGGVIQFL